MFLDPDKPIDRTLRNLPHWEQAGTVSFVTFRMADAIPEQSLKSWAEDRRRWLLTRGMTGEGELSEILAELSEDQRRQYLREFGKRFHDLLDAGHGSCVLRNPEYSALVESVLLHFDGDRYDLLSYVIMPNHVHVLVSPKGGHSMSSILHSWKRFTARELNKRLGAQGQFWQHESFDHLVRGSGSLEGFVRYLRENPEKAKLKASEFRLK